MALTLQQFNLKNLKRKNPEIITNRPIVRLPNSPKRVISNTSSGNFSQASEPEPEPVTNNILTINGSTLKTIANENIVSI